VTIQVDTLDIVVVPFPFTDRAAEKRRPALVLSGADVFGAACGHSVLAMITSQAADRRAWPLDTPITDLTAAGLPAPSLVRMKLFTLDHRLILRRAGRLAVADARAVASALARLFAPG
jgi:mRNA interferase MazF